ncbi:MAG: hypothetical protein V2I43_26665 [Parvularcula sp.]|jgi:hypothetical protein|nr:hypothetical protein [Parvularcula sp.]
MTDPRQLLIGNGTFSFYQSDTAPISDTLYDGAAHKIGNVKAFTFQQQGETKEHFGSYGGVKILDRVYTTMLRLGYTLQVEQASEFGLQTLFYGDEATGAGLYNWNYRAFTPLQNSQGFKGFGRLEIWDAAMPQVPRLVHKDFYCSIRLNNQPEFGDDWFSYELKVDVLSPVGKVYFRNPSHPV